MKSDLTSSCGARLIRVGPGSFVMGSPAEEVGRDYWEGEREVALPYEYFLGATPVTQGEFQRVLPGYFRQLAHHPTVEDDPGVRDVPVDSIGGWQGPSEFCARLTQLDREAGILAADWEYRLPTEAEWEYACRAGSTGATYGPLDEVAWHLGNAGHRPRAVGQKAPNAWGFQDMLGNVWELCEDWLWPKHGLRAARGGSYFNTGKRCRAAARTFYSGGRYSGFRVVASRVGQKSEPCPPADQYPRPPVKPSLWEAVDAKNFALAEQILRDDPDQLDGADDIPPTLQGCIYEDKPEILEWMLDHGANIELPEQDFGGRPLTCAIVHRHQKIIRILVEHGADTSTAMATAQRGLAGEFEDVPPAEAYREIVELLRELGVR